MNYPSTKKFVWMLLVPSLFFCLELTGQEFHHTDQTEIGLFKPSTSKSSISIIDNNALKTLVSEPPSYLSTQLLDRNGNPINVSLTQSTVAKKPLKGTVFYKGHISDEATSLVTLTVTPDAINGMISDRLGNYTYHTSETGKVVITDLAKRKNSSNWTCHNTPEDLQGINEESQKTNYKSSSIDTIGIYFVCDYALFELFAFSRDEVLSYVYDMFHQVQAIYAQEQINLKIEDVHIWETVDPYDDSSNEAVLLSFRDHLGENYSGHFAHLLSGSAHLSGGIALINGLCDRSKSFSYSNVDGAIQSQGGYSWDVHVVAHELGHNFGSRHTHDCVWGPNGIDPIDSCGAADPPCGDAPIPATGGTIMSYCHATGVGVNFSLGFGQEPGDLIRAKLVQCHPAAGESCEEAILITNNGTYNTGDIISGSGSHHLQSTHARWYQFSPPSAGSVEIASCGQGVDTRLFIYEGNCQTLTQIVGSDDDCFSGNGYNYASILRGIEVTEGQDIFIEWDDRWSSHGFAFSFLFEATNTCVNGVQDGDETGVDCGGSCTPCMITCQDEVPIPNVVNTPTTFITQQAIIYNGQISSEAMLEVMSGQSISIDSGFTINEGSRLTASIGNCQN